MRGEASKAMGAKCRAKLGFSQFSEKLLMSFADLETQAYVVSENSIAIASKK